MPKEKAVYDWENDSYAQKWIEGLAEKSKEVYKYGFNNWMLFIEMSPKEQIDKRIKDLQSSNPKEKYSILSFVIGNLGTLPHFMSLSVIIEINKTTIKEC